MADVLSVKTQFDNALAKGADEASVSVEELRDKLTSLQTMMRNLSIGLPMQKVANDFKAAIAQIKDNDPARKLEVWQTAYKKIQDIVGADTIRNAWKGLEDATNPQQILSSFRAIGNEYKRLANEAEASSKKQQQMMKEMYDVALAKYKSNFDRASADIDRSMRGADTSMSQASIMEMKAAVAEIDSTMRGADVFDAKGAEATAEAAKDIDTSMRGADTSVSKTDESMKSLSSTTTKTNGVFKNFIGSLTRIAKLRLLRGIIRAVTQAFKEGTENIYQYSAAMGSADASHFKSTMDGLASSFLYLKNSIGSVVAPLLASLVPALQTVISWVSAALNVLAQFFAILNGQSTYTRAKQTATEWKNIGTAAGGAAAAAKEYKNTIMSFDEIHALNDTPSSGGGGGGGAGTPNYADMFEEAELATSGIAGAFNRLATAVKPIIGGIWDFTKNTVETAFEGMGLGFDALMAVIHGDADEIRKVVDDMGKFVSKHPVLKGIYDGINGVRRFVSNVINDVKLWLIDLIEDFINLPFVSWTLEKLGFNVGVITDKLEENKRKVQEDKDEVNRSIRVWQLWSSGVDMATANSIANINKFSVDSIRAFTGVKKSTDSTKGGVDDVSSSIWSLDNLKPSFSFIQKGLKDTHWGLLDVYNTAKAVKDAIEDLGKTTIKGLTVGIQAAIYKDGGYVGGFADGGIIPRFDGGGIHSADLFLANENNAPELVGRIGNRTAVANQDQMVDVLTAGVIRGLSMMQEGQGSNTEVNVYMNDEVVARAADRGNRSLNRRFNVSLA